MNINNLMEDAYSSIYEKKSVSPAQQRANDNHYDGFEAAMASGATGDQDDPECYTEYCKKNPIKKVKEQVETPDEMSIVIQFLVDEGFVETKEDGSLMVESMSQAWYNTICEEIIDEGMADKGVDGDEAMQRHGIKKHEGPMKVKKLKPRGMRKGEGLGIGARKRQGAGKVGYGGLEPKGDVINNRS